MFLILIPVFLASTAIATGKLQTGSSKATIIGSHPNSKFAVNTQQCGPLVGIIAAAGLCCSSSNFAGTGPAYCGSGCQSSWGTCGAAANEPCGSSVNVTALPGLCCSAYNYAGVGPDYCGSGCQSSWGSCSTFAQANQQCGPVVGIKAATGLCCSAYNYAGTGPDYCGSGCQSSWGSCSSATTTVSITTSTSSTTSIATTTTTTTTSTASPTPTSLPANIVSPPMGSCANFAVLGATAVSFSGVTTTIIKGSVGISPGTAITGAYTLQSGTTEVNSRLAKQCAADFNTAFVAGMSATCPSANTLANPDLTSQTFSPGVYCTTPGTLAISAATVTLDGLGNPNSVWIFQASTTLTVAASTSILLINGAQASNVYWVAGTSATVGASSKFIGTLMVGASITYGSSSIMTGRGLAAAAITFSSGSWVEIPA